MYTSDYSSQAAAGGLGVFAFIYVALLVLMIVAAWKIFTKAGEAGWKILIPFYNMYTYFKITWGNGWFFLLLLVPFANAIIGLITIYKLCKVFGHGFGFFILMLFFSPIMMCVLAFGSSEYVGVQ